MKFVEHAAIEAMAALIIAGELSGKVGELRDVSGDAFAIAMAMEDERMERLGADAMLGKKELNLNGFGAWYEMYPNKQARKKAMIAWGKIPEKDRHRMIPTLTDQIDWRRRMAEASLWVADWPHPATWLNGKRWEDNLPAVEAHLLDSGDWEAYAKLHGLEGKPGESYPDFQMRVLVIMRQEREED